MPERPARSRKPAASKLVCGVHVVLYHVKPRIWRRILVPADLTLGDLHDVLQIAMGWNDSHLHLFDVGRRVWSDPRSEIDRGPGRRPVQDERTMTIAELIARGPALGSYEYDFGDSWEHELTFERVKLSARERWRLPLCEGGERACPPEDVGGVHGYAEFLAAIADPAHEEHRRLLEWAGGAFDPEAFDASAVTRRLHEWARTRKA